MKYLSCLLLALLGITFVYSVTIDTLSENSGTNAQNDFCACTTNNNTCYTNLNARGDTAIGNTRAMLLIPGNLNVVPRWTNGCASQQGFNFDQYCATGLDAQTGCASTGCTGQYGQGGQLEYSTPTRSTSQLYLIWNGQCPTSVSQISYTGLGGQDLTDNGVSDSFNILIGKVDLSALLIVQIWSDATHGSNATFDPSVFAFSANFDQSYTRATLPFSTFSQLGSAGPADFSRVGAVIVIIQTTSSVDLIISLIETAGTLELTKGSTISTDNGRIGVAEPGDIVTYNLTLAYSGTGLNAATVFLWDDPATNYLANNNTFPYYSLVPGSLIAQLNQIDVSTGAFIPITASVNATEVNGPNVQAQLGRVVLYLGDISSYTAWTVQYQIRISSTLPCCLPTCKVTSTGINGESPYCITNTAYFCEANDAANLNLTVNGNQPNFNTAFVSSNCGPTTITRSVNGLFVTQPYYTLTPVYAPSSPYVRFTSTLQATVTSGNVFAVPFLVANNGTRDTATSVTFTYPNAYVTLSGSSSPFTCNSATGSCSLSSVNVSSGASVPYSLSFSVNAVSGCGSTPIVFAVSITPNGCPTAGAGTGACIDVNTADNSAVSSPVNITGTPNLAITFNTTASTIAPGGSAPLSICYSNSGTSSASSAVASVVLPSGFTGTSSGAWTGTGSTYSYTIGNIAAGITVCTPLPTLTVTWNVATITCVNPVLTPVATLTTNCGSVTASLTLTPTANTAISLVKNGPTSVTVGSAISYSLTYTNNGTRQYDYVILTDTIPQNTVYSGVAGWNCSGTTAGSVCTTRISPATPLVPVPFVVTVNSPSCAVTSVVNTATAQGICSNNAALNTAVVSSTITTTVTGNPDLFITKRATDGAGNTISNVQSGGSVTYVMTYGNRGNRATGAVITESAVQSPFTFAGPAGTWTGPDASGLRTFTIASLAPGANGTVTFVVTAASTLTTCASPPVPNTVSIAVQTPCVELNLADNTANASASISASSDLFVNFQPVTPTPVVPTQTTQSLSFCYGNLGNSSDSNTTMTVTLPAGLTATSGTGNNGWIISGNTASVNIGTVAALSAQVCRPLIVNLPATLNCTDSGYNGTVSIIGDCTETNLANNQAPWYLPVTATFDLSVTKTQPAGATFRQTSPVVVYSITYANAGGRTVYPVVLTETVPQYTTFVAASSDSRWVSVGGGVYTINLGSVAANSPTSAAINFAVQISLPIPANVRTITNYVNINNNGNCGAEVTLTNNNASVPTPVVGNPDVFITKTDGGVVLFANASSSSSPRFAGDVVVYTLGYGNNGDSDANSVTITEMVPAGTTFYSALSSSGWSCADGAAAMTTCTANVGAVPIAAGNAQNVVFGTRNFAVRVGTYSPSTYPQAVRCGQTPIQNFASIAVGSDQVEINLNNNNANDTTPIAGLPDLRITLTDNYGSGPARRAGDNIIYTINYSNTGVREATNVVITNTVPSYTVYNSLSSTAGWICPSGGIAGSNCTYAVGSLAPGQNTSALTFVVTVLNGFPANLSCVTDIKYIDNSCGEANYADNSANVCTPVTGYFDLILQKHGYCETILYNISYSNIGDSGARDVFLKAYVPIDSSFNANASNSAWRCADVTPGSECLLMVTNSTNSHSYLSPGAGGSVSFAIDPYYSSMSSTFTVDSSIDANWSGDNLDPTPDNNRVSTTVGFSGCAECNSCCPTVDTCCPDYTDVNFVFSGVLDGIKTCSS